MSPTVADHLVAVLGETGNWPRQADAIGSLNASACLAAFGSHSIPTPALQPGHNVSLIFGRVFTSLLSVHETNWHASWQVHASSRQCRAATNPGSGDTVAGRVSARSSAVYGLIQSAPTQALASIKTLNAMPMCAG